MRRWKWSFRRLKYIFFMLLRSMAYAHPYCAFMVALYWFNDARLRSLRRCQESIRHECLSTHTHTRSFTHLSRYGRTLVGFLSNRIYDTAQAHSSKLLDVLCLRLFREDALSILNGIRQARRYNNENAVENINYKLDMRMHFDHQPAAAAAVRTSKPNRDLIVSNSYELFGYGMR